MPEGTKKRKNQGAREGFPGVGAAEPVVGALAGRALCGQRSGGVGVPGEGGVCDRLQGAGGYQLPAIPARCQAQTGKPHAVSMDRMLSPHSTSATSNALRAVLVSALPAGCWGAAQPWQELRALLELGTSALGEMKELSLCVLSGGAEGSLGCALPAPACGNF